MDDTTVKCDITGCEHAGVSDIEWSSDALGTQVATMCKSHMKELWAELNGRVQSGRVGFRIDRPGFIKGYGKS